MKKRINLTIDSDLYDDLENLPRKISVSEFVSFMLKGYVETFKKGGRVLTQEEVDAIVEKMGGEPFRERMKNTLGPTFDTIDSGVNWAKNAVGLGAKEKEDEEK